jgi:hypothetical protein
MIIFKTLRIDPEQPDRPAVVEVGRIWLQDGHIHASGTESVVSIAKCRLQTVFDGEIDPATDPEKFLYEQITAYHGSRFWAERAPDEPQSPDTSHASKTEQGARHDI